jgi:hypothetical protein
LFEQGVLMDTRYIQAHNNKPSWHVQIFCADYLFGKKKQNERTINHCIGYGYQTGHVAFIFPRLSGGTRSYDIRQKQFGNQLHFSIRLDFLWGPPRLEPGTFPLNNRDALPAFAGTGNRLNYHIWLKIKKQL